MKLLALAVLLATAATLQGCEFGKHSSTEALFTALGAPLPAGLGDDAPVVAAIAETPAVPDIEPVAIVETPVEPVVVPVVAPPPPPPPNEYEVWQNDPTYVCVPIFRIKSCTDDGEPVWLDSNMGWLPFGVIP